MRVCDLALGAIAAQRDALKAKTQDDTLIRDRMVEMSKDLIKGTRWEQELASRLAIILPAYLRKILSNAQTKYTATGDEVVGKGEH